VATPVNSSPITTASAAGPAMGLLWARALVFVASAAVLVLEILAGRLLAPYVGVTLETFTGIIGVVLAGIATGAWLGGWAADRSDPRSLLAPALGLSGILAMLAPSMVDLLGPGMRGGGSVEIVLLTAGAFLLPATTLSAVTPIVVKLRLQSISETGSVVGSFSAIGTMGALAGTFVTGFVLLTAMPSRPLVIALGAVLLLTAVPLAFRGVSGRLGAVAAIALLLTAASITRTHGPCDTETSYFCARVEVDPARPTGRLLWLDTERHSYVDLEDPSYLDFRYAKVVADVVATLKPGPIEGGYIGGGGFTLPRYVSATRPGSSATVFEIDRALVRLAERDLGLQQGEGLRVEVGDGRLPLPSQPTGRFGLIVGDAFGGLSVPWHLTTREFLLEISRVLADDGVYVVNVIDYPPLGFARAEVATLLDVFPHVAVIAPAQSLWGDRGGNFVLVGARNSFDWSRIQERILQRAGLEVVLTASDAARFVAGARVLRDDFAPVDQLLTPR